MYSLFKAPRKVIQKLETIRLEFLWGKVGDKMKVHWISIDSLPWLPPENNQQPGGGGPFDAQRFFNPSSSPPPIPPNPNPNPNHGARLMALLSAPPLTPIDNPSPNVNSPMLPSSLVPAALHSGSGPLRMPSSQLPKGRHLNGERVVYDIDGRLPGEVQLQLEVTPITKYGSDPGLVMMGPLNHDVKIWASDGEEGWWLPSDVDSWCCLQTLELNSSESRLEDAFFNQIVALPQAGLLLFRFTVSNHRQQYALDISQCLPPPIDNVSYEKQDSTILRDAPSTEGLNVLKPSRSKTETSLEVSVLTADGASISRQSSSSSFNEASFESPPVASIDRQVDTSFATDSVTDKTKFKHPTHLVTPAELMATLSSEIDHVTEQKNDTGFNVLDVVSVSDPQNAELEVKVVGETGTSQTVEPISQAEIHGFASQTSDFGRAVSGEIYNVNESKQLDGSAQTFGSQNQSQDLKVDTLVPTEPAVPTTAESPGPVSSTKGKSQKGKSSQQSNVSPPSVFNLTDSSVEPGNNSSVSSVESILPLVLMNQKEIQKQIPGMVAAPVTKEGRRIEAALGKSLEITYKTNYDALWARTQEEFTKQEKSNRDQSQHVSAVVRSVSPVIEKTVSTAITDAFQRGVADKSVNQLEKSVNSKLEATVARHIQTQFLTSGKQALQEALKLSIEASVIPAFEMSCKAMFNQVDATFQKGMIEHTVTAQQHIESAHSPLAIALRDAINSASSVTQTLSGELAEGQRKLVALAISGANSESVNQSITQISNGSIGSFHEKIEAPLDPTKELSRLVYEHKYEEAFTAALQRSDVWIVSWLCSQVDLQGLLTRNPLPLSQGVLLSLLQQLACDIGSDTSKKLGWMMDVVVAIKPSDVMIAMHVRPIFDQVSSILNHQISVNHFSI
ncbi:hypothetical protein SSX86_005965 [Deinandra increscens subsp. villosa]|uniref:Enhancer of mRNA-decapping protein 4 C-terminal domain-containing protein n=1 Tax=Deinandra increscens subsp. villosa TaxID=3103831 RepID=A0AAP0DQZ6_9ASTR